MTKIMVSLSATKAEKVAELEALIIRCRNSYYKRGVNARINIRRSYPAATQLLEKSGVEIDSGVEEVTDDVFDIFWDVLGEVAPKSAVLKRTGAVIGGPTKVKLPYAMNGLSQVRPDSVEAWLRSHPGPYVVSDKLDGISFEQVCHLDGTSEAYTKGDSDMGNTITPMLKSLNVPRRIKADVAIRAEMIMDKSVFDSRHSKANGSGTKLYENPRNMVAGATNPKRTSLHEALGDIDVVAYELLKPRLKPSQQFKKLKELGYQVAPYKAFKTLTADQLVALFNERKTKSPYDLDGLVIAQDRVYPVATSDEPAEHMVKFKFNAANAGTVVKVIDVVWEASKRGMLIPRIQIPPTRISGVTIDWCTGHNAFYIKNGFAKKDAKKGLPVRPIGPGALIRVVRSGDVIPYVLEVVKGARKPALPDSYTDTDSVHILHDGDKALTKAKAITYFFAKLDVEGLKLGTVQKLYDHGLDSILKIVRASKSKFLEVEGIQERTAAKLRTNIDAALAKMTLPALMDASGMFGALGEKRLTWIVRKHPDVIERDMRPNDILDLVTDIRGFKTSLAQQFVDGLPAFRKFYGKLGIVARPPKVVKVKGQAYRGQTVVFTGFRDAAMEEKIVQQGGTVGHSVNKNTTILVVKDPSAGTTKIQKAEALGVKIMSGTALRSALAKY